MSKRKLIDLTMLFIIYTFSFLLGWILCRNTYDIILKLFIFDVVATIIVFIFSVILKNSSVYDPYWSYTPMFIAVYIFIKNNSFSFVNCIFLLVFCLWSLRLTLNWIEVFSDFSYEDWRYKKYREESGHLFWPVVNFWGIHMMPTLLVFAGMLPLFELSKVVMNSKAIPGISIMLWGILLEYFADKQMHYFLNNSLEKKVCNVGLWKYSRHPNYLGEITFWIGVYISMLPFALERWYYGIGCLGIFILFNVVSIPLMEARQISKRPEYSQYIKETSRLFLIPKHSN